MARPCSASLRRFIAWRICSYASKRIWFDVITRLRAAKSVEISAKVEYDVDGKCKEILLNTALVLISALYCAQGTIKKSGERYVTS